MKFRSGFVSNSSSSSFCILGNWLYELSIPYEFMLNGLKKYDECYFTDYVNDCNILLSRGMPKKEIVNLILDGSWISSIAKKYGDEIISVSNITIDELKYYLFDDDESKLITIDGNDGIFSSMALGIELKNVFNDIFDGDANKLHKYITDIFDKYNIESEKGIHIVEYGWCNG